MVAKVVPGPARKEARSTRPGRAARDASTTEAGHTAKDHAVIDASRIHVWQRFPLSSLLPRCSLSQLAAQPLAAKLAGFSRNGPDSSHLPCLSLRARGQQEQQQEQANDHDKFSERAARHPLLPPYHPIRPASKYSNLFLHTTHISSTGR